MADPDEHMQSVIEGVIHHQADGDRVDDVTIYTCPDCGGTLFQDGAPATRFRCHVGHAYGPEVLLSLKTEEIEAALWSCVRMLTEKATLTRQVATRTEQLGSHRVAERIEEQAETDTEYARVIRELLEAMPGPSELVAPVVDGTGV